MTLSDNLLDKLACPVCKKRLDFQEENNRLVCDRCLLGYPIVDDIPVLLVGEAVKIK